MRNSLSSSWMKLGVAALLASGALSVLVTGAKMPFLRPWVTDLEFVRRCLVIHVNLATLVWFAAIPVSLTLSQVWEKPWLRAGFLSAVLGILFMAASAFFPEAAAVLSNYIPVLTHPLHDAGLALFFLGVLVNYVHPAAFLMRSRPQEEPFTPPRFGLWLGGAYFIMAVAALIIAFPALDRGDFHDVKTFFEIGMWGGGHLLQHSSSVFLLVCWTLLLRSSGLTGGILAEVKWITVLLAAPLTILPFLFALSPWSNEYRGAFTNLMMWGIAPPMLIFIAGVLLLLLRSPAAATPEARLSRVTWGFSAFLLCLGFLFGALIEGSDLRVPGHYHATIGAVTIAFLLVSYRSLRRSERDDPLLRVAIRCYGIGQTLFAGGMFAAGAFGVGRKTYGAEHTLSHIGQKAGMLVLGVGGTVALLGGILFGWAVLQRHDGDHLSRG